MSDRVPNCRREGVGRSTARSMHGEKAGVRTQFQSVRMMSVSRVGFAESGTLGPPSRDTAM
jgi:hypothetical protein